MNVLKSAVQQMVELVKKFDIVKQLKMVAEPHSTNVLLGEDGVLLSDDQYNILIAGLEEFADVTRYGMEELEMLRLVLSIIDECEGSWAKLRCRFHGTTRESILIRLLPEYEDGVEEYVNGSKMFRSITQTLINVMSKTADAELFRYVVDLGIYSDKDEPPITSDYLINLDKVDKIDGMKIHDYCHVFEKLAERCYAFNSRLESGLREKLRAIRKSRGRSDEMKTAKRCELALSLLAEGSRAA